jgi:hypothetical protein
MSDNLAVKHGVALGAVTAAVVALGCAAWGSAAFAHPAGCGAPTPVVPMTRSGLTNAHPLGNLLWFAGGSYRQGYATKLLIAAKPHARTRRVVLRGWRCSDRLPLRFWYRNAYPPFSGQVADSVLASTGDLGQKVRLREMRRGRWQMTGYLMFSSPGTWIVTAYVGSRPVGAVVFDWR